MTGHPSSDENGEAERRLPPPEAHPVPKPPLKSEYVGSQESPEREASAQSQRKDGRREGVEARSPPTTEEKATEMTPVADRKRKQKERLFAHRSKRRVVATDEDQVITFDLCAGPYCIKECVSQTWRS